MEKTKTTVKAELKNAIRGLPSITLPTTEQLKSLYGKIRAKKDGVMGVYACHCMRSAPLEL